MIPLYMHGTVRTRCPDCDGSVTTFERMADGKAFGVVVREGAHTHQDQSFSRWSYVLLKCVGCGRGGLATIHDNGDITAGYMEEFHPSDE